MTAGTQYNTIPKEDVIAIMGMTGSGKSTFLKLITGEDRFKVGHGLKSETATIQEFQFHYEDAAGRKRLLCVLDTPGFGDTYNLDSVTLGVISAGLVQRPTITGIIYLHNINEPRLTHLGYQAKEIFYDICGGDAMKNVILCTSQWDNLKDPSKGYSRESELIDDYWKEMIDDGARTARHDNTPESAGEILKLILGRNPVKPKLVTELETPGVALEDTSAGRRIADLNAEKAKEKAELEKCLEAEKKNNEVLEAKRIEEERERKEREAQVLAQLQEAREKAEKLRAEQERKEAEMKLEREKERAALEKEEKARKEAALRADEERKRREAELEQERLRLEAKKREMEQRAAQQLEEQRRRLQEEKERLEARQREWTAQQQAAREEEDRRNARRIQEERERREARQREWAAQQAAREEEDRLNARRIQEERERREARQREWAAEQAAREEEDRRNACRIQEEREARQREWAAQQAAREEEEALLRVVGSPFTWLLFGGRFF